jgi:hypothetical protein
MTVPRWAVELMELGEALLCLCLDIELRRFLRLALHRQAARIIELIMS